MHLRKFKGRKLETVNVYNSFDRFFYKKEEINGGIWVGKWNRDLEVLYDFTFFGYFSHDLVIFIK